MLVDKVLVDKVLVDKMLVDKVLVDKMLVDILEVKNCWQTKWLPKSIVDKISTEKSYLNKW
jgi:hypothetical protein